MGIWCMLFHQKYHILGRFWISMDNVSFQNHGCTKCCTAWVERQYRNSTEWKSIPLSEFK